ncbi:MAG: methylmalonyl-CoA carboxyltransferase [Elusimicrobia bacterium GWA2_61_42]|nr:MAG: methylmalonyl-CoA carboxyltransferase [Elusimicrobia bacterium GWA2_61_42]OGR79811.1 MAG: methylmalonyl-CoA carboxyltransferase [Elusimicrobia bacterium GWC2_61_25]
MHAAAEAGGPPEKIAAQKAKGKLTARERIAYLTDEGSFQELGLLMETRCTDFGVKDKHIKGDGVITGFGKVNGRLAAIFSEDFTQLGGSLGRTHADKITKLMDMAADARVPVIGILDSGGARIQEGVDSLDGYGEIFLRNTKYSGVVPQISIILGPCAGGAVYSPALTDFVFMAKGISHMFVTGPEVVKASTGEEVDFETLGGSMTHASKSGVCHFVANSEQDCFRQVKELMSFLPQNRFEAPPAQETKDAPDRKIALLEKLCELDPRRPYRVHHIIWWLSDDHKFLEVHHDFAKNIVVGFIRLGGQVVGVVANNPAHMAGALDINGSDKAARFIRFLNNFNIPILTLVDVPGYWPGVAQEHGGIIRHGAKLLYAYSEATVPKVTLVLRKAYGGAYIAMSSKLMGGDINFSLPSAEIAVMGPRGAVEILYSRQIKETKEEDREALRAKLAKEYSDKFASPYQTASTGSLDEVLEPSQARARLIGAFGILAKKRRPGEHAHTGNIPL